MADSLAAIYAGNQRSILWQSSDEGGQPIATAGATNTLQPVVFEEKSVDELRITEHPVEIGAAVTDHAYKEPCSVHIRAGWSPVGFGDVSYLKGIYQALLNLQIRPTIVWLVTGKRVYPNMLLQTLGVTNDRDTENILAVDATFQELIFATTQVVSVPSANLQQSPEITQPPSDQGFTSLQSGSRANTNALQTTVGNGLTGFNTGLLE
jgi:hypothetical protein